MKKAECMAMINRSRSIDEARKGDKANLAEAAGQLDYFVLNALVERKG